MYKIGICDDDYAFCGQIEQYLENVAEALSLAIELEIFLSAKDFLKYLSKNPPLDILFLDIELGQTDGIVVGQKIRTQLENEVTQIVYVSAKEHYAIQLFQNRPMDFLVKPITQSDIERVLGQYQRLFSHKNIFIQLYSLIFSIFLSTLFYLTVFMLDHFVYTCVPSKLLTPLYLT